MAAATTATVMTSERPSPPVGPMTSPTIASRHQALWVSGASWTAPDGRNVGDKINGAYALVPGELVNGRPIWVRTGEPQHAAATIFFKRCYFHPAPTIAYRVVPMYPPER